MMPPQLTIIAKVLSMHNYVHELISDHVPYMFGWIHFCIGSQMVHQISPGYCSNQTQMISGAAVWRCIISQTCSSSSSMDT